MFSIDAKNSLFLIAVVYFMFVFADPASAVDNGAPGESTFKLFTEINGQKTRTIYRGWRASVMKMPFTIVAGVVAVGAGALAGGAAIGAVAVAGGAAAGAGLLTIGAGAGVVATGVAMLAAPAAVVYTGAKIISKFRTPPGGADAMPISSLVSDIDYLFILPASQQHASIKELIDCQQGKTPGKDKMVNDLIILAGIYNLFSLNKDYQLSTYDMDEKQLSVAFVIDRDHIAKNNPDTGELKEGDIEKILEYRTFNHDLSSLSHYMYEKDMYEFITDTVNSFSVNLDKNLAGGLIYIVLKKRSAWVAIVPYS